MAVLQYRAISWPTHRRIMSVMDYAVRLLQEDAVADSQTVLLQQPDIIPHPGACYLFEAKNIWSYDSGQHCIWGETLNGVPSMHIAGVEKGTILRKKSRWVGLLHEHPVAANWGYLSSGDCGWGCLTPVPWMCRRTERLNWSWSFFSGVCLVEAQTS